MNATNCERVWEVEAARDGRLTGDALASHTAHRDACAECMQNAKGMVALAHGLRALPLPEANDVALRRLRHRVLAAFDARHAGRGRRAWTSRSAALALAAVLVTLLAGVALAAWRGRAPELPAPAPTGVVVATSPPAPRPVASAADPVTSPTLVPVPAASLPRARTVTTSTPSSKPTGAEAEDQAYLRVLSLLREGREPEARVAARAYVREFPAGFRHEEMQRLADAP